METAEILSEGLNLAINVEPGLAEVNPPGFWPTEELKKKFPNVNLDYEPVCKPPLPKEGYDCTPRLTKAIKGIIDRHPGARAILVVSHLSSIDGIFIGLDCGSEYVGQGTISIFNETKPQSGVFECKTRGSSAHLSAANRKNLR
ncbi:hypothetical protein M3Y99_00496500 [Aphelenchoides fujianensis]|nr:hypothetical protein M3Y99_00496500 [Aphelenchoides fujianensis]